MLPAKASDGTASSYRADIDGLRAIAVLAVVGFHAFPHRFAGGFAGVDVFFVISGYLISGIVLDQLDNKRFSFLGFYARRIRRIFPALIVVLVASIAIGWFALFPDDYRQLGKHAAGGAAFISNFVLWDELGYFDDLAGNKPLLHLWSLGIEEQFYLVWPLLLFLAYGSRLRLLLVIGLTLIVSFVANVSTAPGDAVAAFYSPITRFWELMIGSLLAYATRSRLGSGSHTTAGATTLAGPAVRDAGAVAGIALIAASVLILDTEKVFPGWWALMATLGTFLVIAAGPHAWVNRTVLSNRVLVWFGLISFPLYLWHWPLLSFARIVEFGTPAREVRIAAVIASVALAWITYRLVERPVRFGRRGTLAVASLSGLMAAVFLAACGLFLSTGVPERAITHDEKAIFLEHYRTLRKQGAPDCDFYDVRTRQAKAAIRDACTQPGRLGTWLVWGDSHAQALVPGLQAALPEGYALAQVRMSGCGPSLEESPGTGCAHANAYAQAAIERLKPDVVVLAQRDRHERVDWEMLADRVRRWGAAKVVVVGPAPEWEPSLPLVVANYYWRKDHTRVDRGIVRSVLDTDDALKRQLGASPGVAYVSLVSALCNESGCLGMVPGSDPPELMAIDYGHLSPRGSIFVVDTIVRPYLYGGPVPRPAAGR